MGALERTIARARRRAAIDLALLGAGRGAATGLGLGLLLLALDRGTGVTVPLAAYPIAVVAAVAAAIAAALLRRPGGFDIAVRLDRVLDLKDRLGTGVAIGRRQVRGELTELAGLDAQRVAERVDVRPATPIRVTPIWPVALVLAAALTAGVAFLPAFGAAAPDEPVLTPAELEEQRVQIVETIDETLRELDEATLETVSPEETETLERLAEQLAEPADDAVELARLRDESAAKMEEMADALAEDARRNLEVVDEVTRQFAAAEEPEVPSREPPAELGEFLDAVERGELGEAADRFDELLERQQELPALAREALARELRELAERMDPQQTPGDAPAPDPAELERLREALKDLGVDEQALQKILDEPDTARRDEALQEALDKPAEQAPDEPAADEETRRQIAEDLAAARERQDVREQADEQRERLSEALERAADELREQPAERTREQHPQPPDGQQQPQPQDGRQPQEQPSPDGQQQPQQQQQPPAEGQPREGGEGEPVPREGREGERVARETPEGTPGAQEVPRPGQTGEQPGEEQAVERQVPAPGEQPEMPGETPSVSELLRRMQQARDLAEGQQADSEKLREAARRLADTMTDEQKQELLEQWMQMQEAQPDDQRPPSPGAGGGDPAGEDTADQPWRRADAPPSAFEDVDLRDELDEHDYPIMGEWLSDAPVEGAPAPAGPGGRAAVSRARSAAEQAIEKSIVPSRYHDIIRRYFGRLEKTVDTPPAKPVADGAQP